MSSLIGQAARRAVLDLICCPFPKKLLVLLRVHMANVEVTAEHWRNASARFYPAGSF
jgi:hypothetical protein